MESLKIDLLSNRVYLFFVKDGKPVESYEINPGTLMELIEKEFCYQDAKYAESGSVESK